MALTPEDLARAMRSLKQADTYDFAKPGGARTWTYENPMSVPACVVALTYAVQGGPFPVLAATVAHEAVHVWQTHCDHIGEHQPGREQEAYAVEWITRTLLEEFERRTFVGPARKRP